MTATTLSHQVGLNDQVWSVGSVSDAVIGGVAACGNEWTRITSILVAAIGVVRGSDGTRAGPHVTGSAVQIGSAEEFSAVFGDPPQTWVAASGVSPARTVSVTAQDGDETITIATVTY
jgi:hypothetical protein